jgi:hypothetical protein
MGESLDRALRNDPLAIPRSQQRPKTDAREMTAKRNLDYKFGTVAGILRSALNKLCIFSSY